VQSQPRASRSHESSRDDSNAGAGARAHHTDVGNTDTPSKSVAENRRTWKRLKAEVWAHATDTAPSRVSTAVVDVCERLPFLLVCELAQRAKQNRRLSKYCSKADRSVGLTSKNFTPKNFPWMVHPTTAVSILTGLELQETASLNLSVAPRGGVIRELTLHPPGDRSNKVPVPLASPENVTGMV